MLHAFSMVRVTHGYFLRRMILGGVVAVTAFLIGMAGAPAPAEAGPCFDRCMTRCNMARGYTPCRLRCFKVCSNPNRGMRMRGR